MNLPKSIFITGTDTSVGKTVVTAAICSSIKLSGKKVAAMKPVQTGTETQQTLDIEFVYKVLDEELFVDNLSPYRLTQPLSPKLASQIDGVEINVDNILSLFGELSQKHDHVIVEGSGGMLAPIRDDYFISDLIVDMNIPIIIVARPGLGTINHTLLTIESAINKGIKVLGIIINKFPLHPNSAELTNPSEISSISKLPILGIIPEFKDICVERGSISNIRENSKKYLCELLGGVFHWNSVIRETDLLSF